VANNELAVNSEQNKAPVV